MNTATNNLLSLKFRVFRSVFRRESLALWFLCFYILIEYIRPHMMYPVLDFLPWGQSSLLLCFVSVFITNSKTNGFSSIDKLFIIFTILLILSAVFAWNSTASFEYWSTYTSWILMYFCIVSILTTPNRIFLFIIFFAIINFKLSQHGIRSFAMRGFSFSNYGLSGSPGWFHNSGEFAMQMVIIFSMTLPIIFTAKKHIEGVFRWHVLLVLFPGFAALTVIGSSSRGGQLALLVVIFIYFMKSKNFLRNILVLSVILAVGYNFIPNEQLQRFHSAGEDATSTARLIHWKHARETIKEHPLGIGYNNWMDYYYSQYNPEALERIHNTILQAYVELGIPGGSLFLLMLVTSLKMNATTKKEMSELKNTDAESMAAIATGINLGIIGTFVAAFFMSVLYYPPFWLAFALTSVLRTTAKRKLAETGELSTDAKYISFQKKNNTHSA
jgi:putative inorganic carbon (HCO3(-)) transporter